MFDTVFSSVVSEICSATYFRLSVPCQWGFALLTLLFKKKGDPREVANYRGITLSCNLKKVYELCLANRFLKFLETRSFSSNYQAAFRSRRSTSENVYLLEEVQRQACDQRIPVYAGLFDLKTAFATVLFHRSIDRLVQVGCSSLFIKAIYELMSGNFLSIVIHNGRGNFFPVNRGLGEGSVISPVLFILILNSSTSSWTYSSFRAFICPGFQYFIYFLPMT